MLQEITVNDLEYIRGGLSRDNLLKVYNMMVEHQDELIDLKNFYFDKNFAWERGRKCPVRCKNHLKFGYDIYGASFDYEELIKKNYHKIREFITQKYPGKIQGYQLGDYLGELINKLRPTDEYYKNYLEKEMKNSFQKKQAEILEREKIRQASISEEEKEGDKFADWVAEQKINEKKNYKKVANAYIYGIYIDNKLAYIGKTIREMKNRLGEHLEYALLGEGGGAQQNYLYKAMRECEVGYKFKILYESYNTISNHELEEIEKTLIENLQPEFNYEGVKVPYRFSEEKR